MMALLFAFAVVGCATHKTMVPISGSKADGIVKMAYEYTPYESPIVNQDASRLQAAKRCQAWGFSEAEAFSAGSKQCVLNYGFGCEKYRVVTEYQCTGQRTSHTTVSQAGYHVQNQSQPMQQIIINIPNPAVTKTETAVQPINRH
ncbi:YecR family lipoprotein [Neisseria chenwenguii]|nr:YecR family lipoprotein [Neisseria chenwenguii]ROV57274.1 hypothetical protein EGS38_00890 [Neisseria chenwenguii]